MTKQSLSTQIALHESSLVKEYQPSTVRYYSIIILHFFEWKNADVCKSDKINSSIYWGVY